MKNYNIKDLEMGFFSCESCGRQIYLSEAEPLSVHKCPSCGHTNFVPYKVSRYWLYKPLGGGGMGRVYKALCLDNSKEFAVKLLPGSSSENKHLIENLFREAKAGKDLGTHKNIISIIDYGQSGADYYIVSEFVEGDRMDRLIESIKRFSEKEAWTYALQIIEAEKHIISRGYLFRDLKPENILIQSDSTLKLYDYGLCLSLSEAASGVSHSDEIEGSPFYLPPERVVGAPEGEYSEIYSLGMIVFHMLAGRTYYSEAEIKDLITKHVTSLRISSVETHLKHCHQRTIEIIDRMIKRRPNDRYHTFDQLKSDIEALLPMLDKTEKGSQVQDFKDNLDKMAGSDVNRRKIPLIGILIPICLVLFVILITREYLKIQRKKENRIKIAASLKINPDIAAPEKSLDELKKIVREKSEEKIKEELAKIPPFDEKQARIDAAKMLAIDHSRIIKPELSLEELEKLRNDKINQALEEAKKKETDFDTALASKRIIESLGLKEPLPKPSISLEQAKASLRQKVEEEAKDKFSSKELGDRIKKIYEENRAFRKGEIITITDGTGANLTGVYSGRKGPKVVVGEREILIADLPPLQRWRFDEVLSEKRIAELTEQAKNTFNEQRSKFIKEKITSEEKRYMEQIGFIKSSDGSYITAEEFVAKEVEKMRKKHIEEASKKIKETETEIKNIFNKEAFYKKHGYCKYNNKWLPQEEATELIVNERKRKYEEDSKKIIEAKKRQIQYEIEQNVFKNAGYIFHEGTWQPAKTLLDKLVEMESK